MTAMLVLALFLQDPPAQQEEPKRPVSPEEIRPVEKKVSVGQRREGDVLDVPSAVTLITEDQIRKSGASNIVEVLRKTPGFFSQGANKGAYDQILDLRGYNNGAGNGQRTLVLVDGRKTNQVVSSATDWASIPLENVERVEIVRGPASALYGDGALAGVVNIITKRGGKEGASHAGGGAGNWGTYQASVNFGTAAESALLDFFAGIESTQGWRDNSEFRGNNLTARVEGPLAEGLRFHAKVGRHEDSRERPGTLNKTEIEQFGRNASVTTGNKADVEEGYLDGGLTQSLGELGEASLFFNYSLYDGKSNFGAFVIDDASKIWTLQLKHTVKTRPFSRDLALTTGADFSYETADADSAFGPVTPDESEYRRRLGGVYEHLELRPFDALIVTASARYDRALLNLDTDSPFGGGVDRQRAFDQWSPHAGLTVRILEELSAYASWGRTFKYPTRDELIGFTSSAPDLEPERSHTYEAGVRFVSSRWGSASVSVFKMIVKDEIYFDPTFAVPPFGFGTNINFDEVTHQGIETEARATPWEWLEIFATHTFTRVVVTESESPSQEGKTYPVTPRLAGTVGLTASYEGASLTLSGRYAGDRFLIRDFDNTEDKLDSYWVFDTRAAYTWKGLTLFASVFNVTDREYFDSGGIAFGGELRFNPAPERSWLVGAEVRF